MWLLIHAGIKVKTHTKNENKNFQTCLLFGWWHKKLANKLATSSYFCLKNNTLLLTVYRFAVYHPLYISCWFSISFAVECVVLTLSDVDINRLPAIAEQWSGCKGNTSLQWRHNDHDGVSNLQPHGCLLNRLFGRRSKKTPELRVTGLCAGNSPGPVNSPHKGPVTRKMLPFDDVIMLSLWTIISMNWCKRNVIPVR